jgi:gliding motility-associated-like protein
LGETVTIQANTFQDSLFFTWLPDQWLSCNDCPSPLSSPETTILYTLTAFDQNDCSASDSILVTVEFTPGIYVPNAFSPNGDGINDHFYIQGKGISEVRLLRVFDRWGEMVFESLNATPNEAAFGWDGTFRNKQMNPAVFAFYAELGMLDGSNRVVKGDVTLLR